MAKTETIQDRLNQIMKEKGVNPRQMAISSGIDPSYFNKALKGMVGLTIEKIESIASFYGVDVNWLRGKNVDKYPQKPVTLGPKEAIVENPADFLTHKTIQIEAYLRIILRSQAEILAEKRSESVTKILSELSKAVADEISISVSALEQVK